MRENTMQSPMATLALSPTAQKAASLVGRYPAAAMLNPAPAQTRSDSTPLNSFLYLRFLAQQEVLHQGWEEGPSSEGFRPDDPK